MANWRTVLDKLYRTAFWLLVAVAVIGIGASETMIVRDQVARACRGGLTWEEYDEMQALQAKEARAQAFDPDVYLAREEAEHSREDFAPWWDCDTARRPLPVALASLLWASPLGLLVAFNKWIRWVAR